MKKNMLLILSVLIILFPNICYCNDIKQEPIDRSIKYIEEQMEDLNIKEIENSINNIDSETFNYFPKPDIHQFIIDIIKGNREFSLKDIFKNILKIFFFEIKENMKILVEIIVLTILCAILSSMQNAFEKETVSELGFYICYMIIVSSVIKSFIIAMNIGENAISNMVKFMQALLPVLLTLLVAVGGKTSSLMIEPIILGSTNFIGIIIKDIVYPLILFSTIIGIVSKLSSKIQFSRLSKLLRQITISLLGIILTFFIGIISMDGLAASIDGIGVRTAKFAVDNFVPVVGSFLADAVETVVSCSGILKNAIGFLGHFILFLICIIPIIKVVALILIYKIAIVTIEPIGNERIIDCLNEISKGLTIILASIFSVIIMFYIAITIIIKTGDMAMMLGR